VASSCAHASTTELIIRSLSRGGGSTCSLFARAARRASKVSNVAEIEALIDAPASLGPWLKWPLRRSPENPSWTSRRRQPVTLGGTSMADQQLQ
jgi:hypothetical protein